MQNRLSRAARSEALIEACKLVMSYRNNARPGEGLELLTVAAQHLAEMAGLEGIPDEYTPVDERELLSKPLIVPCPECVGEEGAKT